MASVKIQKSFSIPGAHTLAVQGTQEDMQKLLKDKRVSRIEPDKVIDLTIHAQSKNRLIPSDIPVIYAQAKGRLIPSSSDISDLGLGQVTPWGIKRVGGATDLSGSSNVVYILDSGVDTDHPDLNVDKELSRNFTTNRANDFEDDFGHGTHVAGIIGAKDNTVGVVGVAAGVPIVAVKVLDQNGTGTLSDYLDGLSYILGNAVSGDVVNISLGATKSELLDQAVKDIRDDLGVTVVIAAGNQGDLTANYSPANITESGTYVIGSTGPFDLFSSFSNYGPNVNFVAPGEFIYSTWKDGGYGILSGTSMAAPHVAGLLMVTGGQLNEQEIQVSMPSGNQARVAALP
jgi:subtilisin family serine protease